MTRYSLILVDFDIVIVGLLSCAVHEEVGGEGGGGDLGHYILKNVKTLQS